MKYYSAFIIILFWSLQLSAQKWDTYSDTWVTHDGLGRTVYSSEDGLELPNERQVGMFYFICNGSHGEKGRPVFDISEMLRRDPDNVQWGKEFEGHWWGRPVLGYYTNDDKFVYEKHLQMLCDAGVDFLFFDVTNAFTYDHAVELVMEVIDEREAKGMKVPKLAYMVNAHPEKTIQHIYEKFYTDSRYDKYWFVYEGKPLMLADPKAASGGAKERFTFRRSWAWMEGKNPEEWAWLEYYPQKPGWSNRNGVEQVSVSIAQHATTKVGKSYHNGKQPPVDKYALCEETPYGLYYQEQWNRAHEVKAPIAMITQFNEWTAMRFVIHEESALGDVRPGQEAKIGESAFVDTYNAEFNRDIEPSWEPTIRDNYYLQTVSNIRKYKGARPLPMASGPKTIVINENFSQWRRVSPEYRDDIGDVSHRDTKGYNDTEPMVNNSGRNDIVMCKVARDKNFIYFYVRTKDPITLPWESNNWMTLFINIDCDYKTGWEGYDYCVKMEGGYYFLCFNMDNKYRWRPMIRLEFYQVDNELHLAVPKDLLGIAIDKNFDFKWADNIPDYPDILDFYTQGDVAPNGRFNYRYKVY